MRATPDVAWGYARCSLVAPLLKRLRAPSTAEFPYITADGVRVEHLGEQVYMIQAYVDAENAFGGTVRTYFVGTMEQVERNTWQLRSLEFVER